jgi:excisionase family DNA binding protein
MMRQEPPGVVSLEAVRQLAGILPSGMARAVVDAAVHELAARSRRDGTAAIAPGVRDVLSALDVSASGQPFASMDGTRWVSTAEAARLAGVSERSVRRLAESGRIRARRPGRDWQVDHDSAQDYGRERRHASADDDD